MHEASPIKPDELISPDEVRTQERVAAEIAAKVAALDALDDPWQQEGNNPSGYDDLCDL